MHIFSITSVVSVTISLRVALPTNSFAVTSSWLFSILELIFEFGVLLSDVEAALEITNNNRAAAADLLGLSRQSLYVKLSKFEM